MLVFFPQFAEQMSVNLNKREEAKAPNLVIFVESARGLLNLQGICERAFELSELGAPFHLDGIVFGSDDFCADIGELNSIHFIVLRRIFIVQLMVTF